MSGLIDRQDAIEAIRNIKAITGTLDDELLLIDKAEAQTELMMLPSAESEIIRCRNCKHYISGSDGVRYCFNHDDNILWQDDDFCSRAERRTDE